MNRPVVALTTILATGCTSVCLTEESYETQERIKKLEPVVQACINELNMYQRGAQQQAERIERLNRGCET